MLVAYGPEGQPVVAEEAQLAQLQSWSHDRALHCPNCRGIVHVRGGTEKRTQLHFAHQKGECAWSTESESVRHASGKLILAHWLRTQYPQARVTLEERLPEPNRIADIFVMHPDGQRQAIEFQCAPLDIEEWKMRHTAYRKAGISDSWIIGNNRREKQEAFIEAILGIAHEIMFLDPLVTPARIWLRWSITRQQAQEWQDAQAQNQPEEIATATLDGRVGHMGYGMTILGSLHEVQLNRQAKLIHPVRVMLETRARLQQAMSSATTLDEATLHAYLNGQVEEKTIQNVLIPLTKAYLRDPDLLRRYNYGRGTVEQPVNPTDIVRVHKAQAWLQGLIQRGFSREYLQALGKEIPFVGPYAAFAGYFEMLLTLINEGQSLNNS